MINGDGPQVQKPVYYFTSYHILQGMTIKKGAIHFTREFDTSKLKRILQSLETGLFFCQIFVFII